MRQRMYVIGRRRADCISRGTAPEPEDHERSESCSSLLAVGNTFLIQSHTSTPRDSNVSSISNLTATTWRVFTDRSWATKSAS